LSVCISVFYNVIKMGINIIFALFNSCLKFQYRCLNTKSNLISKEIYESILNFLMNVGILVNSLIIYILWKKGHKQYHYRILFIIFLFVLITQVCFLGYTNKNKFIFYSTFIFQDTIPVFIGPLLFIYVKTIFLPVKNLWKKKLDTFYSTLIISIIC